MDSHNSLHNWPLTAILLHLTKLGHLCALPREHFRLSAPSKHEEHGTGLPQLALTFDDSARPGPLI